MASLLALRTAAHQLDLAEPLWLRALCDEGRALLDDGVGTFAYSYRVARDGTIQLGSMAALGAPAGLWEALSMWGKENERSLAAIYDTRIMSLGDARLAAKAHGSPLSDPREPLEERHRVRDLFTVVAHESRGCGVILTAPRTRCRTVGSVERRAFSDFAWELVTVSRLRRRRRAAMAGRPLSAAERRVADMLLEGKADKEIAFELEAAPSTVSTLTRRMREKLGCRNGEELLRLATPDGPAALHRRIVLFARLTASERAIAAELLMGHSYREIAERRRSAVRTVAAQCATIFRKCHASGRRQLAAELLDGSGPLSGK